MHRDTFNYDTFVHFLIALSQIIRLLLGQLAWWVRICTAECLQPEKTEKSHYILKT